MTATMWPDLTASIRAAHEAQAAAAEPARAAATERAAERERREAAAAASARPRNPASPPSAALRLPERSPGVRVGGAIVNAALGGLYRALVAHSRGWPAKRRARVEAALVELEEALR